MIKKQRILRLCRLVAPMSRPLLLSLVYLFVLYLWLGTPFVITLPVNSSGEDIQKALDSLSRGGEVVLRPGTYLVHKPLILQHSHQVLRGSGPETILFHRGRQSKDRLPRGAGDAYIRCFGRR